jgi:hypothetical protein
MSGLLAELLHQWALRGQTEHERAVLTDALEASGTMLGQLCSLQQRLAQLDDPLYAQLQARLGTRDSFGPRALFVSNEYHRWKLTSENRVRDRRVKFELVKIWREALALVTALEKQPENELTAFSTFVALDHGLPAALRTTAEVLLTAPRMRPQWSAPHLELVCHSSTDFGQVLSHEALQGSPSVSLVVVGNGSAEGISTGSLALKKLALSSTDFFRDDFLRFLANAGWLEQVESLRMPSQLASAADVQAVVKRAPRLKSLSVHTLPGYNDAHFLGHIAPLGALFSVPGFSLLRLEGVQDFTSYADWFDATRDTTTWREVRSWQASRGL